jgi:hypothetical protein
MEKRSWNGFKIMLTSVFGKPQLKVDFADRRLLEEAVICAIKNFDLLKGQNTYITAESLEKLELIRPALLGLQNALKEVLQENGRIVRVERSISERWAYILLPAGGAIYCIPEVKRIPVYGASLEELESWINS